LIEFPRLFYVFNFATVGPEKHGRNRDNECAVERAAQRARRKREKERERTRRESGRV